MGQILSGRRHGNGYRHGRCGHCNLCASRPTSPEVQFQACPLGLIVEYNSHSILHTHIISVKNPSHQIKFKSFDDTISPRSLVSQIATRRSPAVFSMHTLEAMDCKKGLENAKEAKIINAGFSKWVTEGETTIFWFRHHHLDSGRICKRGRNDKRGFKREIRWQY